MIVVIADDLSGAAELAGAAVRQGLSAEVQTTFDPGTDAEVLCVDTDTRMLSPVLAAERVSEVARGVVAAKPAWVFKKCDSVLRGSVLAEARALAAVTKQARILLAPANPSRERTISAGIYRIAGRPLHETAFAHDPLHPRRTASVKALLGEGADQISVPDILTSADVERQVPDADANTLPVGGLDFFTALLTARTTAKAPPPVVPSPEAPTLVVCGSEASWAQRCGEAAAHGISIFSLPHDTRAVVNALGRSKPVLIGIGNGPATRESAPQVLTAKLARSVATILGQIRVERLFLEGGATSAAVIAGMGWTRLRAESSPAPGVGILRPTSATAPLLAIKPGSYPWPAALWP